MQHAKNKCQLIRALALVLLFAGLIASLIFFKHTITKNYSVETDGMGALDEYYKRHGTYYNGDMYIPKEGITTLLLLGLDKVGKQEDSHSYVNSYQCDFVTLIILDSLNKEYTVLQLNRDTMTTIQRLGLGGKVAGTFYGQLALAHTYGNGLEESCENAVTAVSYLLYDIPITHYCSMTMDAVSIINDAIGGVTLLLPEDYTELNASYTRGSRIVLFGEEATAFIRARSTMNDATNVSRMQRQKLYINSMLMQYQIQDYTIDDIVTVCEDISPYLITDCTMDEISMFFDMMSEFDFQGVIAPEGEQVAGDVYMEFYVDDDKLKELVISLFYRKA